MKQIKIDLHTHSVLSYDGGVSANDFREALLSGRLDFIAITDHNEIAFAQNLQNELGNKIIIGEEIMCEGKLEIIGLFLNKRVLPGLSLEATISKIHQQGGLVYIPHPLDNWRHGLGYDNLQRLAKQIDIIEGYNARSYKNTQCRTMAIGFSANHDNLTIGAGSDAHSKFGLGKTYSVISEAPDALNLKRLLRKGKFVKKHASLLEILAPSFNKFAKRIK